jgi:hypothetical protein
LYNKIPDEIMFTVETADSFQSRHCMSTPLIDIHIDYVFMRIGEKSATKLAINNLKRLT